jgi:hypothetical protein
MAAALAELEPLARGGDPGFELRMRRLQEEIAWERQAGRLLGVYEGFRPPAERVAV